ncbi:hypothetical protein MTR_4g094945 [Medicago truncatula]|uniref:Uncharacterized protein n=1 Tax=Medicago truncatula TaxID=3880 RepID=A0A072UP87_MEDTR|nr:hypothetical protein MTR_4g094945 [Medicago truncatula]
MSKRTGPSVSVNGNREIQKVLTSGNFSQKCLGHSNIVPLILERAPFKVSGSILSGVNFDGKRIFHEHFNVNNLKEGRIIHVTHNDREANTCADALNLRGHYVDFSLVMLDYIPASLSLLLDKDLRGACSPIVMP